MKKKFVLFTILSSILIASFKFIGDKKLAKVNTNDDYEFIAVNNIKMWVSNNGDGSHYPNTDGSGFYWPGGRKATQTAIFEDGLIWGGLVDGDIRVNGNTHRQGLQAGKILENGQADDPTIEKYRVYKIRKNWEQLTIEDGFTQNELDSFKKDYEKWPGNDGAPFNDYDGDGIYTKGIDEPKHEGDETLWFVSNDLDSHRTTFTFGKPPIGLEVQTTVYGFNNPSLEDVVFKKYKIINKGFHQVDSMFFGYWSDADLGDAGDDYFGCDIPLNLSYYYNSSVEDDIYGDAPPSVGFCFIQGPKRNNNLLDISSSAMFIPDPYGEPIGIAELSLQMYNYLNGILWNGKPYIDPHSGEDTKYVLSGDPVTGTGWYEGHVGWPGGPLPGDRRALISSGPVTMAPGDTQEVVIAIIVGQGLDNINSINHLRFNTQLAQFAYDTNFEVLNPPATPNLKSVSQDKKVTLYWDDEAEKNFDNQYYEFEGYRLWQYSNLAGDNPIEIAIIDIDNDLKIIYDKIKENGLLIEKPVIITHNSGLSHTFDIEQDIISGKKLLNGNPYYFGISAFSYLADGRPKVLESIPRIIKTIPGQNKIDISHTFENKDFIEAKQISGDGDGTIGLNVIDPEFLNGHTYKIFFEEKLQNPYELKYTIFDQTDGDTLVKSILSSADSKFNRAQSEVDTMLFTNGFQFVVQNTAYDSIEVSGLESAIKEVVEINGSDGVELDEPINVAGSPSSRGDWRLLALSEFNQDSIFETSSGILKALNWKGKAGQGVFEIRFTSEVEGSEYYLTGYRLTHNAKTAAFYDDPKAVGKVPFQIWFMGPDVGDTSDDQRLIIKIQDEAFGSFEVVDSTWSQLGPESNFAGKWETIYAYFPIDSLYPESLPEMSGLLNRPLDIHKIGNLVLDGSIPESGTVVRIDTWQPLSNLDTFVVTATAPVLNDYAHAKENLNKISVFPNPYFGTDPFGRFPDRNYMRFTDLPQKVIIRIFTLSGQLVQKIEKESDSPWLDWDLRNRDGRAVASGIYLAHLDMPHIGKKIMKLAVVQDNR